MSQRRPNFFQTHPVSFNTARARAQTRAYCEHVDDGDSYDTWLDLGYTEYAWRTARLKDFDTPETHPRAGITKAELRHGLLAKARVRELIENQHLLVRSYMLPLADKEDITLARYVMDIWHLDKLAGDWILLRQTLAVEGFAKRTDYPADG